MAECKALHKVIDDKGSVILSWVLAKLYPEKVDTLKSPLRWTPGMVREAGSVPDERLKPFARQARLITAGNYDAACCFLESRLDETEVFCLDLETTTPEESDDWLDQRCGRRGIDVIASTIVACGLAFGANGQYGYYVSVDNADPDTVTLEQLAALLELRKPSSPWRTTRLASSCPCCTTPLGSGGKRTAGAASSRTWPTPGSPPRIGTKTSPRTA